MRDAYGFSADAIGEVSACAFSRGAYTALVDAKPHLLKRLHEFATHELTLAHELMLLLGRYPALIIPLAIAASLARKRAAPESPGTLQVETPTFALTLIAVVVILTLLQFMPVLVLGPVADHLALSAL